MGLFFYLRQQQQRAPWKLAAGRAFWHCFIPPAPSCSQIALFPRSSHLTSTGCTLIYTDKEDSVLHLCLLCSANNFFFLLPAACTKLTSGGGIRRRNRPASLHSFLRVRWSHYSIFMTRTSRASQPHCVRFTFFKGMCAKLVQVKAHQGLLLLLLRLLLLLQPHFSVSGQHIPV